MKLSTKSMRAIVMVTVVGMAAVAGCGRSSPRQTAANYLEAGKKQYANKDFARAVLSFRNAAKASPKAPEPHYQMALAHLGLEDYGSAIRSLQKAVELDPKHIASQIKLAELMTAADRSDLLEGARKLAGDVLTLSPDNPDALVAMAVAELRLGKQQDGVAHLQQVLAKVPQHLNSSVLMARVKLAQKDSAGAEEVLLKMVRESPKTPEAVLALGQFYSVVGKNSDAEAQFRRALEIDANSGAALVSVGALLARAGRIAEAEPVFKKLSVLTDKQYRPLYAVFLFENGKREAAIAEFERLAKQDPKDRTLRSRLVTAYVGNNRIPDAEQILSKALRQHASDTDALEQRSQIYLVAGRYEDARKDLREVLRFKPESSLAHYVMAKTNYAVGETAAYRQELGEALRLDPEMLGARLELAESLRSTGAAKTALELLDKMPEGQKNSLAAIAQRNWILLTLADEPNVRKGVDQGMRLARIPEFLVQDAAYKLWVRNTAGARASAEEALKQSPEDMRAMEYLAESYVQQKQIAAGAKRIQEYADQRPKSAAIRYYLGTWLSRNGGDAQQVREALSSAAQVDPRFVPAGLALAKLDVREEKYDSARQILDRFLAANDRNVEARLTLAMLENKLNNIPAAIENYRKVLSLQPTNRLALNNLAYVLLEHGGQADEALRLAQQAKELAPKEPWIDDTIGWAFYHKGLFENAAKHLEAAVSKEGSAVQQYHLAMAYTRAGDRKRAEKVLQTALRMDPNVPEAKTARELLARAQ
ncbi:MAG: tetratricopeptide repeat protein [Acidobacteria bacterium]|nr:tetratricopeptide repeat protein [Acidobacteriota bacterium]